jgi:hypothetical protein
MLLLVLSTRTLICELFLLLRCYIRNRLLFDAGIFKVLIERDS